MLLRCPSVGPSVAPTRNFIFKPKLPLPFSSPIGPSFCYLDIFLSTVFLLTHHRTLSLPKPPSLDARAKDGVFGERRGNVVIQNLTAGQRKLVFIDQNSIVELPESSFSHSSRPPDKLFEPNLSVTAQNYTRSSKLPNRQIFI